jgi:hypothetical protein
VEPSEVGVSAEATARPVDLVDLVANDSHRFDQAPDI